MFLKISFIFNFYYVYAWVCMGVCAPECWCPLRPKALNPPEARVKDAREPPSVGGLAITPGSCVSPLFTAEATFSLFYFSSFELNSNIEWLFFHHHFAFLKVKSIEFSCFLERPFFSIRKKKSSVCLFLNLYWRDQTQGRVACPAHAFTVRPLQGLSFLWNLSLVP